MDSSEQKPHRSFSFRAFYEHIRLPVRRALLPQKQTPGSESGRRTWFAPFNGVSSNCATAAYVARCVVHRSFWTLVCEHL